MQQQSSVSYKCVCEYIAITPLSFLFSSAQSKFCRHHSPKQIWAIYSPTLKAPCYLLASGIGSKLLRWVCRLVLSVLIHLYNFTSHCFTPFIPWSTYSDFLFCHSCPPYYLPSCLTPNWLFKKYSFFSMRVSWLYLLSSTRRNWVLIRHN